MLRTGLGGRLLRRSQLVRLYSEVKTVETCPKPEYDTGCTHCEVPDPQLFNETKNPNNTRAFHWKHFLVSTGTSDWPKKVEFVPGSFTSELAGFKRRVMSVQHPVMITSTSFAPEGEVSGYLLPDGLYFKNLDLSKAEKFAKAYLVPEGEEGREAFQPEKMDHSLVLVCGHGSRDARCGQIAPLLVNEFEKVLEHEGLLVKENDDSTTGTTDDSSEHKWKVGVCSHIGGHVYAGNVLLLKPGGLGVWYGNVRPSHVQGIVKETVKHGNIITELHRGGRFETAA